ncbi:MAG: glycosyltransferase family 4 protein, partial [Chthoniobacterales bacterium]|nr:glycosyltransferase family 4 protein [Chthoniobacterales bacterium]
MKITIVLGAFLPVPPIMGGAVEKVWFALGQEFARRGHEVTQISRARPQFPERETIEGVRHLRIAGFDTPASLLWLKFFDLVYSVRTKRRLPRADIIVTNTFWLPLFLRNSRWGKLYVHIGRFPKRQMCLYQHAARLQTPSRAVADAVAKEVPKLKAKIVAIPYPRLETNGSTGERATVEREKNILFVGRVHPEKGVHLLIDAFANAAAPLFFAWNLIIVGPTENRYGGGGERYLDQLRRSATRSAGRVHFRGAIFDPVALSNEYRQAQIFAYPSLAEKGESFGLAPLEAMAHGCAVIVSDLACFHDFIRDGETGIVFNHRGSDPAGALRAKLAALVGNETGRSQ